MNWFESLVYGLVAGFADFLPISSTAHGYILHKLFGVTMIDPVQSLLIHFALLAVLFQYNRSHLELFRRQRSRVHNHSYSPVSDGYLELRFLKNAIFPMCAVYLLLKYFVKLETNLAWVAIFSLVNGIMLFSQGRMLQGNKNARSLSALDSVFAGIASALFIFPGISRMCAVLTIFTARGIGKEKSASWAILLSIPALLLAVFSDILSIITNVGDGVISGNPLGYFLSAAAAYAAGYFGISVLKRITAVRNCSGLAYYSWGIALFSFILYLTVV